MQWSDAIGKQHARCADTPRIVSLVPSLTELLVDLGLAEYLVGRTGFCIHPRQVVRRLPKLGGTKGFSIDKLRALAPTHVLVNIDENRREEVEALHSFVPHVIVTHPLTVRDNLDLYEPARRQSSAARPGSRREAAALAADFEREWAALCAQTATLPRQRVLYLIWQQPWLSVARDTYISRMLAAAGWDSLPAKARCATRKSICRRWPREAELAAAVQRTVPVSRTAPAAAGRAAAGARATLIDGEMVSWYGSRAIRGWPICVSCVPAWPIAAQLTRRSPESARVDPNQVPVGWR
jgi:hypothetical protein